MEWNKVIISLFRYFSDVMEKKTDLFCPIPNISPNWRRIKRRVLDRIECNAFHWVPFHHI